MRFRRHSDRRPMEAKGLPEHEAPEASTIGAPSAGLSLGGLHACRARLRFARHHQVIAGPSRSASARQSEKQPRHGCHARIGRQNPAIKLTRLGNIPG